MKQNTKYRLLAFLCALPLLLSLTPAAWAAAEPAKSENVSNPILYLIHIRRCRRS